MAAPTITGMLRARYVFEAGGAGRASKGKTTVSPATMTVKDAPVFRDNAENYAAVR
jgi:hypothetical protein